MPITEQPTLSSQLRISQPSILAWVGILIQSWTHMTCDLKVEVIPSYLTLNVLLTQLVYSNAQLIVTQNGIKNFRETKFYWLLM